MTMNIHLKRLGLLTRTLIIVAPLTYEAVAQISLTDGNLGYSQNFDSLTRSTTAESWTNNTATTSSNDSPQLIGLAGWYAGYYLSTGLTSASTVQIRAGTGSSTTGAFYSFGASSSDSDRALGSLPSDGITSTAAGSLRYGVRFVNNTSSEITGFTFSYTGEQWRNGGTATVNSLVTAYGIMEAGTGLLNRAGAYTDFGATADFSGPITGGTAGLLDGNASANRSTSIGATVTGISWGVGQELWIRWLDVNNSGTDSGLAIDDFTFTAVPEPSASAVLAGLCVAGLALSRRRRREIA